MSDLDLGLLMSAVIDALTGDFDAQANYRLDRETSRPLDHSPQAESSSPTASEGRVGLKTTRDAGAEAWR